VFLVTDFVQPRFLCLPLLLLLLSLLLLLLLLLLLFFALFA
jgi:hypothetical protein